MKKVLSASLGSSTRDHTTEADFLGEHFWLSRQGTDGDFERYLQMYRENDGVVDAFGVGGAEFYLWVNNRRYYFREAKKIRQAIKISKVGDGNGIKHLLAPLAMQALREHGVELRGKKALKTTAVDRYGLAKALVDAGCQVTFGDFIFALGLPIPIHSLSAVHLLAAVLLPVMTQLPLRWLYPLGTEQEKEPSKKYSRFCEEAEIIAGDFLQVWRYLPDDLSGKIIVTNTTTARNVEALQQRNLHILVTNTPRLQGRSFGTNVIEAMCRCLVDKPDEQITWDDLQDVIDRIPLRPQVHVLN
ncbi:MAG TPA: hypothetical protein VLA49_03090 [Anaerolineales bacterium]|nr:hypothetical protein [Anaerolineales bacterium]